MKKLVTVLAAAAFAGGTIFGTAVPAFADGSNQPAFTPYEATQDWYAPTPATVANPFAVPQTTKVLTCGGIKQHDDYTIKTAVMETHYKALIAGGVLKSSAGDAEFSPHGYTVTALPACVVTPPVVDKCATNFSSGMWEISWGRQFSDTNGTTTFTMASYGGMTSLNGSAVPAYMVNASNWRWLYVHKPVANATWNYGFKDGTHITAVVTADSNSCPTVVWTVIPPVVTPPVVTPPVVTPPVVTPPVVTPPVVTPPVVTPPVVHHTTVVPPQKFEANTGVEHASIISSWMVWGIALMLLLVVTFSAFAYRTSKEKK